MARLLVCIALNQMADLATGRFSLPTLSTCGVRFIPSKTRHLA